jgi:hypothetical protein
MKHKNKTFLFKTLALLPNLIGDTLYHKLQRMSNANSVLSKIKSSEVTYDCLVKICEELKISLENKSILEIGSGWFPIMPYFFKYKFKVKDIFTYDINKHYHKKAILEFNSLFSRQYDCTIDVESNNKYGLPSGIDYFPSKNVIEEKLPQVDLVFSRYVLSHATTEDVIGMHKKFIETYPKGTYLIHFISPSDLRQHGDASISLQDFLQYSKEEWDKIQTKYDSHNRLRLPQFVEIFKSLGLEIVYLTYESSKPDSLNMKLLRELKLHNDYQGYTEEELTAGNIVMALRIQNNKSV